MPAGETYSLDPDRLSEKQKQNIAQAKEAGDHERLSILIKEYSLAQQREDEKKGGQSNQKQRGEKQVNNKRQQQRQQRKGIPPGFFRLVFLQVARIILIGVQVLFCYYIFGPPVAVLVTDLILSATVNEEVRALAAGALFGTVAGVLVAWALQFTLMHVRLTHRNETIARRAMYIDISMVAVGLLAQWNMLASLPITTAIANVGTGIGGDFSTVQGIAMVIQAVLYGWVLNYAEAHLEETLGN